MADEVLAVIIIALRNTDNTTLATASNSLRSFGKVGRQTAAYAPLRDKELIDDAGQPVDGDTLAQAIKYVINERVKAGTFQ